MELLAPVGGEKQLKAAIAAGADAIYLGMNKFSARASAENFDLQDLANLILKCHSDGIKIYVAVNILIKNDELDLAIDLIDKLYLLGVDGLIIQDFGLLYLIRGRYINMEIHASTQMSIHNKEGALYVKEYGIDRVVLARELSLEEIRDVSQVIDTEVFVHGAICISYSGQCLFSSSRGKRSANRGRCAQPCRMQYLMYENDKPVKEGLLISPKDRAYIDYIKDLEAVGVRSLKIEGRMRNEYYVYETVRQYKRAMEGQKYDLKKIASIFKREEFTSAYLHDDANHDMITSKKGKNTGIYLGRVKNGLIELAQPIGLGDGIYIEGKNGFIVTKIEKLANSKNHKNKFISVNRALKGDKVKIYPGFFKEKDIIYKTSDCLQKKEIEDSIRAYKPVSKDIRVKLIFIPNKPMKLIGLGENPIELEGDVVEEALNRPLKEERVREQIEKKSNPYISLILDEIDYERGFVRISAINKLRRAWIDKYIEENFNYRSLRSLKLKTRTSKPFERKIRLRQFSKLIIVNNQPQLEAFMDFLNENDDGSGSLASMERMDIALALNIFNQDKASLSFFDARNLDKLAISYYIKAPTIIRQDLGLICDEILKLKSLKGVLTANLGLIKLLGGKTSLIGYYDLNIINSYGGLLFPDIDIFMPSEEMTGDELRNLIKRPSNLTYMPLIYGKSKLMNMEYCPNKTGQPCKMPCRSNKYQLNDGKSNISIVHDRACRVSLYDAEAKNHISILSEYKDMGYNCFCIEFIDESRSSAYEIIRSFINEDKSTRANLARYKRGIS